MEISPQCGGGICVVRYCGGCPVPFQCRALLAIPDPEPLDQGLKIQVTNKGSPGSGSRS
jgi:hypothetical protein